MKKNLLRHDFLDQTNITERLPIKEKIDDLFEWFESRFVIYINSFKNLQDACYIYKNIFEILRCTTKKENRNETDTAIISNICGKHDNNLEDL